MPTDTQVNDLKINVLSEAQYEQIQSPSSTELYLVPEVVDTTPTSGSTNPITSGGVYNALQNIPAQEQSDWNETDNTDPAFIKNKPSIPDSTSDLTNDSGFITANDVPQEVLVCNYDSTNNTMDKTPEQILQAKDNGMAILCKEGSARIYYCTIANQSQIFFECIFSDNIVRNFIRTIKWSLNSGWSAITKEFQERLISSGNAQNIKTINNESLLGSGNISISSGDVNVQSDWDQSDNTADDYIKNKPTIPTVPTNVSAFTNDAGYITNSDLPTIDTALSETSTNPVQNKAISTELRKLWDKVDIVPRLDNEYVRHDLYIVSSTNNKWGGTSTSNYKHWIVPVSDMREVIITANDNTAQAYSFFKSYSTPVAGDTPDYATGYSGIDGVSVGETLKLTVPDDAEYLYINTGNNGAAKAAHIYLTGVGITEHNGTSSQVVRADGTVANVVTVYSGSSAPSSGTGSDGDIYIQTMA